MNPRRYFILPAFVAVAAAAVPLPAFAIKGEAVILGGLDKVTGRISRFEVPISKTVKFGNLEIIARTCDKRPPTEPPESAAYLEIREQKDEKTPSTVFRGWMFASSPALSAMEHAVYDVWVVSCKLPAPPPAAVPSKTKRKTRSKGKSKGN